MDREINFGMNNSVKQGKGFLSAKLVRGLQVLETNG